MPYVNKELDNLWKKRDFKERSGFDTSKEDAKIITSTVKAFDMNDPVIKKADRDTAESILRYEETVGTNLHPVVECKRACDYIFDCIKEIKKSKDLVLIEKYTNYITVGATAILVCTQRLAGDYMEDYKSPYMEYSLEEIDNIPNLPPVNKVKEYKRKCDRLKEVLHKLERIIDSPTKRAFYQIGWDITYCNESISFIHSRQNKKSLV